MDLGIAKTNDKFNKEIAKSISQFLYSNLYKGIFKIIEGKQVNNTKTTELQHAIIQGLVYYRNGAFYSKTGRFNSRIASELINMGAKYSKFRKAFFIPVNKISTEINWAIGTYNARKQAMLTSLVTFLTEKYDILDLITPMLKFDHVVNQIMLDLQKRVYANARKKKIELITPKLDTFEREEIARRYTKNLEFWVKDWTAQEIVKMRNAVGKMAIEGKTTLEIADYFEKEFGIAKRKALFLARNENAIATTSYLVVKYQKEGFEYFKWHTTMDGRQRELHAELNGKVFSFSNPPIIDTRTQQRGYPADVWNCRCAMSPILDSAMVQRRREMYANAHR